MTTSQLALPADSSSRADAETTAGDCPRWDAPRRQLTWQGELVKRFRVPAGSQEALLAAFEEEGWPPRIDDPLTPVAGQDSRERLHEAVRGLNGNQNDARLRFSRDGTGQGVLWEEG